MNGIYQALETLQNGEKWTKNLMVDKDENRCMLGAMMSVGCIDTQEVKEVILEVFPERVASKSRYVAYIPAFNDHPDTTFDDVRVVLQKAGARLDEAV